MVYRIAERMGGAVTLRELKAMNAPELAELIAFESIREQEEGIGH